MTIGFGGSRPCATALALIVTTVAPAHAGEIGHYNPAVPSIRDFAMPEPGFYGVLYNYFYSTDRLNDKDGDKIDSVTINPGPGPGLTIDVDVDVDVYAVVPTLIWVSDWDIFGVRYGAFIAPTFANSSVSAGLSTTTRRGRSADQESFGAGDLFVQPIWLGWSAPHLDAALGYGFYAPIGKYDTETVTLPVVGSVTTESSDNIGLGFWTHQFQGAVAWYPWEHRGTAAVAALTWEVNGEKQGFDLTPGQHLTLNWGVSQYLPLNTEKHLLLELGPTGYSSWQITDDDGSDARNPDVHDEVHAIGGQLGLTYVPWNAALNAHYFYEFSAQDRFQGHAFGLNLAIKLGPRS